ncbi:MAG: ABC transporter substrate-binding protein [Candidatus Lambdaproteobacteria bacterium]|nr:ABC transporter substrate-binding protein [Candidatus Lambdaproteobacteria bacterium]
MLNKSCSLSRLGVAALALMASLLAWAIATPVQAQTEILIGGTIAQSGSLQGIVKPFGALGQAWVDDVNSRGGIYLSKLGRKLPVRMILYDDQSEPPTALKQYERLATVDKVHLFIGPFSSFVTNAAMQASIKHKIPFFMVEANDAVLFEENNNWRATGLAPAAWEYKRVAELYKRMGGASTFAVLSRDNLHERGAAQGFADEVKRQGFTVVYKEEAPKDIKDFSSIILAMKGKNPDVVLIEALPPPWNIGFLKQARELGLNPQDIVVGHTPIPVIKGMGESAENIVSSLYMFDGDTPDHLRFAKLCAAAGFEPWQYSESGIRYRAYRRIEDALERAGSLDADEIRIAMWTTGMTLFGEETMKHDHEGYGTDHPYPTQVKGGKHVSLWPLEKGAATHQYKMGKW